MSEAATVSPEELFDTPNLGASSKASEIRKQCKITDRHKGFVIEYSTPPQESGLPRTFYHGVFPKNSGDEMLLVYANNKKDPVTKEDYGTFMFALPKTYKLASGKITKDKKEVEGKQVVSTWWDGQVKDQWITVLRSTQNYRDTYNRPDAWGTLIEKQKPPRDPNRSNPNQGETDSDDTGDDNIPF